MWLMLPTGFVSLVQDRKDPSKVWVRARVKEDIANTFPKQASEIITKVGADYIYRLLINKEIAAAVMWNQVMDLDYDSHAKEVMNRRSHPNKDRMTAYYACWTALAKMQPYAPYSHTPRPVGGYVPKFQAAKTTGYTPNQGWQPGRRDQVTTYQNGQPYDWDNHPQSSTYKGGKVSSVEDAVDLINGLDDGLDDVLDDADEHAITQMTDAEWDDYVAKRETEYRGPAGKRGNPRKPRQQQQRRSRRNNRGQGK